MRWRGGLLLVSVFLCAIDGMDGSCCVEIAARLHTIFYIGVDKAEHSTYILILRHWRFSIQVSCFNLDLSRL